MPEIFQNNYETYVGLYFNIPRIRNGRILERSIGKKITTKYINLDLVDGFSLTGNDLVALERSLAMG